MRTFFWYEMQKFSFLSYVKDTVAQELPEPSKTVTYNLTSYTGKGECKIQGAHMNNVTSLPLQTMKLFHIPNKYKELRYLYY